MRNFDAKELRKNKFCALKKAKIKNQKKIFYKSISSSLL